MKIFLFAFAAFFAMQNVQAQVPLLSSYPAAPATIYLDFDGHYVEGTSWNMNGPITCGPANLDAGQITEIFHRVSEDYRPFNVNITTDSTRYWAAPANQRVRIIFTITSEWYGSAGGVSYIGSFSWGDNTPAFVFTKLLQYSVKNIAEAASHEAGHTLYLRHQAAYNENCGFSAEYNPGKGSGEIGWAPIMGVGYYRNFTLWNNGANPYGCTNFQNDLEIITTYNGFSYRPDDHPNTIEAAHAAPLNFVNNQLQMNGVIETSNDLDVARFDMPVAGNIKIHAKPFSLGDGYTGANLDLQVELIAANQQVIATYNPANELQVFIDTVLNAGSYYLRIKGMGNIYAPDYASLGSYQVQAQLSPAIILPVQQLSLRVQKQGATHQLHWILQTDEILQQQLVEVSENGTLFATLASLNTTARTFNYKPARSTSSFYRLKLTMANGHSYYSNTVAIDGTQVAVPLLEKKPVGSWLHIKSSGSFHYLISDYSGRQLATGSLTAGDNQVPIAQLSSGLYIITFNSSSVQHSEKFFKQ